MLMRYGFTEEGFTVVDDDNQVGEFAYYSSPYWTRACKEPERVAAEMLAKSWKDAPAHLKEEHYRLSCEQLNKATRWPKRL